jgi:hypothetical protein
VRFCIGDRYPAQAVCLPGLSILQEWRAKEWRDHCQDSEAARAVELCYKVGSARWRSGSSTDDGSVWKGSFSVDRSRWYGWYDHGNVSS